MPQGRPRMIDEVLRLAGLRMNMYAGVQVSGVYPSTQGTCRGWSGSLPHESASCPDPRPPDTVTYQPRTTHTLST